MSTHIGVELSTGRHPGKIYLMNLKQKDIHRHRPWPGKVPLVTFQMSQRNHSDY